MRQLDAVHDGHANVGKQEIESLALEAGKAVGTVARLDRLMAVELQCPRDEGTQRILVLGNQDFRHHGLRVSEARLSRRRPHLIQKVTAGVGHRPDTTALQHRQSDRESPRGTSPTNQFFVCVR
ncbi:hypothetical protein D9M72_465500 [compost metagenome]